MTDKRKSKTGAGCPDGKCFMCLIQSAIEDAAQLCTEMCEIVEMEYPNPYWMTVCRIHSTLIYEWLKETRERFINDPSSQLVMFDLNLCKEWAGSIRAALFGDSATGESKFDSSREVFTKI